MKVSWLRQLNVLEFFCVRLSQDGGRLYDMVMTFVVITRRLFYVEFHLNLQNIADSGFKERFKSETQADELA